MWLSDDAAAWLTVHIRRLVAMGTKIGKTLNTLDLVSLRLFG